MDGREIRAAFRRVLLSAALALLATAGGVARADAPSEPTADELADARRIFAIGLQDADRGEWDDAVVRFRQVLEVREAPPVFYNLGAALVALGQYPEAEPLLRRVVDDPNAEASLVERARASLQTMATRGGRVTIRLVDAPSGAVLYVDNRVLPTSSIGVEIPMTLGEHELVVRYGADELTRRVLRISIGDRAEAVIALGNVGGTSLVDHDAQSAADSEARASQTRIGTTADRAERRRHLLRNPWLWTGVGAGVVLIVTAVLVSTHEPTVGDPVQGTFNPPLVRF